MDTIYGAIEKHGTRKVAEFFVDKHIQINFGMCKSDLPDTAELCEIVDELEEHLKDDPISRNTINEILSKIDFDFIQDLVFS